MVGRSRYPAGPLAYVGVGLLVVTWASIRLWRGETPPALPAPPLTPLRQPAEPIAPTASVARITSDSIETPASSPIIAAPPPATEAARVLDDLATMPMVAEIAPPVASRIEYDPVATIEPEVTLDLSPVLVASRERQLPRLPQPEPRETLALAPPHAHIERAVLTQPPHVDRAWPYPMSLVASLNTLAESPAAGPWARQVLAGIDKLFATTSLSHEDAIRAIDDLERLSDEAKQVAVDVTDPGERILLSRVSFALVRRLLVWRQVEQLAASEQPRPLGLDTSAMNELLTKVETHFAPQPTWKDFLLLKDLRAAVYDSPQTRGALARRVLQRLEAPQLDASQLAVIRQSPVTDLAEALKPWAAEPADLPRLLEALEQLEMASSTRAAREVTEAYQRLRWSSDEPSRELADHLNTYYRNANVRLAVGGELLNMLLPQPAAMDEPVHDHILGARVFGRSQTSTRLRIVLLPDMRRLRLGLEAIGEVDSATAAMKGPATFYSQGRAQYHARKVLSIDHDGLRVWRSEADADADNELTDLETDFDSLPFVGLLARMVARQQHDDNYPAARWQMRRRVASRAQDRFDSEVDARLVEAERKFIAQVYNPLVKLNLDPVAVDLRTTREQLIARYRIAGDEQLAAFTPRPAVPTGSLLNIQLHESTMNNVVEQLKLDGRRVDLETLYREICGTFNAKPDDEFLQDLPEDVTVEFAEHDAIRVHCDDGRLMLVIRLAEISQGRERKWRNFVVQAYYTPTYETIDAGLVRDGTIELIGERLNFRDQIALRGIFSKVLSKNRVFPLVHEKLASDPRLKPLAIEQFVIQDGWIGLSVGRAKSGPAQVAGEKPAPRR